MFETKTATTVMTICLISSGVLGKNLFMPKLSVNFLHKTRYSIAPRTSTSAASPNEEFLQSLLWFFLRLGQSVGIGIAQAL